MISTVGGAEAPPECEGAALGRSDPNEISKSKRTEETTRFAISRLPAIDCDLLTGIKQIARWYGYTVPQVRAKIAAGEIPVFRLPGRSTLYALKSSQHKRWHQAEEAYLNRAAGRAGGHG